MDNLQRLRATVILSSLLFICTEARADILGFGDFSGFTLNIAPGDGGPLPTISPGKIKLTTNSIAEARSIFYNVPQPITQFTASFTYQAVNGNAWDGQGGTFVLHNSPLGLNAVGNPFFFTQFGYGGAGSNFNNSAAISLELTSTTATGLYTNGAVSGSGTATTPLNLLSAHPIDVTLSYNGSILSETLVDSVTQASFSTSYFVDLPSIVGGTTAFVGFTASNAQLRPDEQFFWNFEFISVPEPSSVVVLAIGGLILLTCLRGHLRRATKPSRTEPRESAR